VNVSRINHQLQGGFETLFENAVYGSKLKLIKMFHWNSYDSYEGLLEKATRIEVVGNEMFVATFIEKNIIAVVTRYSGGTVSMKTATNETSDADVLVTYVKTVLVPQEPPTDKRIDLSFWSLSSDGPRKNIRRIDVPLWRDIKSGYPSHVVSKMTTLLEDFIPAHGGQLLLWHGPPGVGKTYALRALCASWKDWCDVEYIVDPDAFFSRASYLMHVLLQEDNSKGKWKLLILEDSGELLSQDATQRTGQGLSRLLNVVDGFIGQGLKILVLITTNEDLGKLHPAVSRPGRAAVKIHFTPLSKDEAEVWLSKNTDKKVALTARNSYTLSELYALIDDFEEKETELSQKLGFVNPVEHSSNGHSLVKV